MRLGSEREFHRLLESVTADVQVATFHWRLYGKLRHDIKRYVREFNEAPAFWSLTMSAHGDAALFRLVRLYEPDGLNLAKLIETVRANLSIFHVERFRERLKDNQFVESLARSARAPSVAELNRDLRVVASRETLVRKLLALRNMLLAHRDPRVVLGSMSDPLSGLSARQVSALLKRASRIVNRYWRLFSASSHSMRIMGEDDYRTLLEAVRERRREWERRFREELKEATAPRRRRGTK